MALLVIASFINYIELFLRGNQGKVSSSYYCAIFLRFLDRCVLYKWWLLKRAPPLYDIKIWMKKKKKLWRLQRSNWASSWAHLKFNLFNLPARQRTPFAEVVVNWCKNPAINTVVFFQYISSLLIFLPSPS